MRHLTFYGQLGTFSWRMLATVLGGESVIVFFGALVARAMASAGGDPRSGMWLAVGSALAVLCLLAAGMMRRPWGVTLLLVGLLFLALWVLCMVQGARVDILQAQRAAEARGDSAAPPSIG